MYDAYLKARRGKRWKNSVAKVEASALEAVDTLGADKRGAKRIVFSNDGLIYYTEDHYETFELLYGEES